MQRLLTVSFIAFALVAAAISQSYIPTEDMCSVVECGNEIMNYDIDVCQPANRKQTVEKCFQDKVLKNKDCKGNRREVTETWLRNHDISMNAHCGAVDIRNGCDITECNRDNRVRETLNQRDCIPGLEFIDCLKNKILKDEEKCEGEQRQSTEKGVDKLEKAYSATCGGLTLHMATSAVTLLAALVASVVRSH